MTNVILQGNPDAGNPHARFDGVVSVKPRRWSLLHNGIKLIVVKELVFLVVMVLPFLAMADMPGWSHVTYVHRLHRIGYELLKDECDNIGAVDCVTVLDYNMVLLVAFAMVLVGLVLVFCKHIVQYVSDLNWSRCFARLGKITIYVLVPVAVVLWVLTSYESEIVSKIAEMHGLSDSQVAIPVEYVEEAGWVYADDIPFGWLGSCVSAVERIRKPLKRQMRIAPNCWNNTATTDVIDVLKSTPTLLKQSKGIAIEVLVAAVRAAEKDGDYWKNIGKVVRQEQRNPNHGRCSRCGTALKYDCGRYCPQCHPRFVSIGQ